MLTTVFLAQEGRCAQVLDGFLDIAPRTSTSQFMTIAFRSSGYLAGTTSCRARFRQSNIEQLTPVAFGSVAQPSPIKTESAEQSHYSVIGAAGSKFEP